MNARHPCAHVELAVAWAMRPLEPGDEDTMAEHLPTCPVCRRAVRETDELVWALAAGDEQVDPAPGPRESLMAAVASTPQLPVEARRAPWPPVPPRRPKRLPDAASRGWHSLRRVIGVAAADAARTRRGRILVLVTAALIALVGAGGLAVRATGGEQPQQLAQARARDTQTVLAEISRPGWRHAVLDSSSGQPVAGVLLSSGQPQVASAALKPNDVSHDTYVLWGAGDDGRPVAVGAFDTTAGDHALHAVGGPVRNALLFSRYAISIEGGRAVPETPGVVIASGHVAS